MSDQSPDATTPSAQDRIESVLSDPSAYKAYAELLDGQGQQGVDETLLSIFVGRLTRGSLKPEEFVTALMEEYRLDEKSAKQVTEGIMQRVLSKVEKDLPFALDELVRDPSQDVSLRGGSPSSTDEAISSDKPKEIASAEGRPRNDTESRDGAKKEDDTKLDKELEDIKQQKAAVLDSKGPLDIPGIVKEICENPVFQFQDSSLRERCEKLIESRVRDVRTPEQTRAQLEKSVDKGGLGVTGRRLSDMLALIEGRVAAYQGNLGQEEQRKRLEQRAATPDMAALAKKEETLLTKKYIQLTGKIPDAHVAPAAPSVSRTSVAISAHHEQIAREGKIDAGKVKEAIQGAQQAAAAPRPKATPSMQEVTFEKRLSGPIDELHSLALTDFRRLSKDPMQAATKVKDKVDLMEELGYDKKVEAIQAWRASPLNQMYVGVTRDAVLTGTSVNELLTKKRTAGEETLTDEELKAVMKLNADLRF